MHCRWGQRAGRPWSRHAPCARWGTRPKWRPVAPRIGVRRGSPAAAAVSSAMTPTPMDLVWHGAPRSL